MQERHPSDKLWLAMVMGALGCLGITLSITSTVSTNQIKEGACVAFAFSLICFFIARCIFNAHIEDRNIEEAERAAKRRIKDEERAEKLDIRHLIED